MSEQLIPLRIADQAVAACNAEIAKLQEDNARLKRQVEELKEQPDPLTAYLYAAELSKDNVRRLKAFAERLIKAGDAVCESPYVWETDPAVIAWRSAKQSNNYET